MNCSDHWTFCKPRAHILVHRTGKVRRERSVLVSVVIPAWNAQLWLAETLGSVLAQTHKDLEIVLIDDGSSDHTATVADEVLRKGPFSYRILRQGNKGVSAARNRGWRAARGSWIQFLDADDLLHPRKIELQIGRSLEGDAVDVVYSDWQKLIWRSGTWQPEDALRTPTLGGDILADILRDQNFQQLGCLLFRADVLEAVGGFDESHQLVEDVEMCIKIAMNNGVFAKAHTDGPVSWYRDRPRSLSKLDQRQFVEACIRNARLVEQFVMLHPDAESRAIDAIIDVYYGAARYFADHDWKRFEEVIADIEKLRPAFVPSEPARLRLLSRITGYRTAEKLAGLYRRSKGVRRGILRDDLEKIDRSKL